MSESRGKEESAKLTGTQTARRQAENFSAREAAIGVPLARLVPRKLVAAPELVVSTQPRSFAAERFRRLRSAVSDPRQGIPQVLVVTSPAPGEGKSLVSMNLALALAFENRDETTLIVDGDLRRPTLGNWLTPQPALGLAEVLLERAALEHAIFPVVDVALEVLPAGDAPGNASDLLSSEAMKRLISELRNRYTRIIIDTPPIIPLTDAVEIGRHGDGILLVARAGVTPVSAFRQATELATTAAPLIGTVLNDLEPALADRRGYQESAYYKTYYSAEREK